MLEKSKKAETLTSTEVKIYEIVREFRRRGQTGEAAIELTLKEHRDVNQQVLREHLEVEDTLMRERVRLPAVKKMPMPLRERLQKWVENQELPHELALITRAKTRDAAALNTLYNQYRQRVYQIALLRMGNPDKAKKVVQDVFDKAFSLIDKYDFSLKGRFSSWLIRITNEVIYKKALTSCRLKRWKALKPGDYGDIETALTAKEPTATERLLYQEATEVIITAINELPLVLNRIITQRVFEERPFSEISRELGLSVDDVRKNYLKAINRLKNNPRLIKYYGENIRAIPPPLTEKPKVLKRMAKKKLPPPKIGDMDLEDLFLMMKTASKQALNEEMPFIFDEQLRRKGLIKPAPDPYGINPEENNR